MGKKSCLFVQVRKNVVNIFSGYKLHETGKLKALIRGK